MLTKLQKNHQLSQKNPQLRKKRHNIKLTNNGICWRYRRRSPVVFAIALTLFHQFWKKKCSHRQHQEPGMFSKKTDGAASCFEKKGHNRPNNTWLRRSGLCSNRFKPISQICSEFFQSVGNYPNICAYCDARGQKDGRHGHAIFLKDLLDPFSERQGIFSFRYLSF